MDVFRWGCLCQVNDDKACLEDKPRAQGGNSSRACCPFPVKAAHEDEKIGGRGNKGSNMDGINDAVDEKRSTARRAPAVSQEAAAENPMDRNPADLPASQKSVGDVCCLLK